MTNALCNTGIGAISTAINTKTVLMKGHEVHTRATCNFTAKISSTGTTNHMYNLLIVSAGRKSVSHAQ